MSERSTLQTAALATEYSDRRSETVLPVRQGASGAGEGDRDADQALTRSEEELHVGKEQREAGRARLRK